MTSSSQVLLAFFVGASGVAMAAPAAAASHPAMPLLAPLPHGLHLARNGRYVQDLCDHDQVSHCLARRVLPASWQPGAPLLPAGTTTAPIAGTMTPADVLAAYSIPSSTSAGGKIVAVEDMPYKNALADLNVYRTQYGIPPLARCSGAPAGTSPCFAVVDQDGNLDPSLQDGGDSADSESGLDLDMVSAACPDCSILFVEYTSSGPPAFQDFVTAAQTAASMGALATTISWGGTETGSDPTGFTQPGKMIVLAAAGDGGYLQYAPGGGNGSSVGYPGSAPDVLSVGGTNLQATAGGYTETVWNDSMRATTSGCSGEYTMPSYQATFLSSHAHAFGACTARATSDLAAAAAFVPASGPKDMSGIGAYVSSAGGWQSVVGTSASSPLVAAILVRLGLAVEIANDLGFVYQNMAAFNDVTSGSDTVNVSCTDPVMCTAGPGWDGPTGVGTPNGAKLAALLGSSPNGSSASSSGGSSASSGSSSGGLSGSSGASSTGSSGGAGASSGSSRNPGDDGGGFGTSSSGGLDGDAGPSALDGSSGLPDSGSSAPSGCACAAPGASSPPVSDVTLIGLLGGVTALLQARRRR